MNYFVSLSASSFIRVFKSVMRLHYKKDTFQDVGAEHKDDTSIKK